MSASLVASLPRQDLGATVGVERRLADQVTRGAYTLGQLPPIMLGREIIEMKRRLLERVGRLEVDPAATRRTQLIDVDGERLMQLDVVALAGKTHGAEMVLKVRVRDVAISEHQAARLPDVRRRDTGTRQQPLDAGQKLAVGLRDPVDADRLGARDLDDDRRMVLQVSADARQVQLRFDADGPQMVGRSNAGDHHQLGRVDGAAGKNDLAFRTGCADLAMALILDRRGAIALDDDATGHGIRFEEQVLPLHRGPEVGRPRRCSADRSSSCCPAGRHPPAGSR